MLDDDGCIVWDSTAILYYLAASYGNGNFLPQDNTALAQVMQWLALEQNEGRYGLARAHTIVLGNKTLFAKQGNLQECQQLAQVALAILQSRLQSRPA